MKLCIVGTGYVGLVSGACFAEIGHEVTCVDQDRSKVARLERGEIPMFEPGLPELVEAHRQSGRLRFTAELSQAIAEDTATVFLAVGTPAREESGDADLSYVFQAAEEVGEAIAAHRRDNGNSEQFIVIVTKSTVPMGTSGEIADIMARHLKPRTFAIASNPEFLREGNAIADFMAPDRLVVGSQSERARILLEEIYKPLTRQGRPLVVTSTVETAELIKYTANAFLATKVTFINEIARLCEKVGAHIDEVALGVGLDHRIGPTYLKPGPGFGGSCIPKDTLALIKTARDYGSPVEIVETVIRVNERHKELMIARIREALGQELKGKRIGVLGLAFKANTDDVRDSAALKIVPALCESGAQVVAHDPKAMGNARNFLDGVEFAEEAIRVAEGANAVVVLTEWPSFTGLPWEAMRERMAEPICIDLRNILNAEQMQAHGFKYYSLGR